MTTAETLDAFTRIAQYCKSRGWHHRLKGLREQYAKARNGVDLGAFAQLLLETMRLPPFENALEVWPAGRACCGGANQSGGSARTVVNIEDHYRLECTRCERHWLVKVR